MQRDLLSRLPIVAVLGLVHGVVLSTGCGSSDSARRVHPDDDGGTPDASTGAGGASTGGAGTGGGGSPTGGTPGTGGAGGGPSSGGTTGTGGAAADSGSDAADTGAGGAPSCEGGTTACAGATCVDLSTDPAHCGDCARDCAAAGATCDTGRCSAVELDPHASAYETAFGGGALYVVQSNAIPVSHYTIVRIPVDGSPRKQVWDADGGIGDHVAYADATDLYWANTASPPQVLRKAASAAPGDAPTELFQPAAAPRHLTIQAQTLYWVTGMYGPPAYVYSRPIGAPSTDHGTQIVNVDQKYVSAFTATSDAVYWIARDTGPAKLWTVPFSGGTPTEVPGSLVYDTYAVLFPVGNTLYFGRFDSNTNSLNGIYVFAAGDTTARQLLAVNGINALIVDSTALYYRAGYVDALIWKAPLTGGAGVPIVQRAGFGAFAGQDQTYIYTSHEWGSDGPALKIVK